MKQKTTATKVTGFLLILIGLSTLLVLLSSRHYDYIGFPVIAMAIVIATGGFLINDYKSDDTDTKT